jgi:hypothetical protein
MEFLSFVLKQYFGLIANLIPLLMGLRYGEAVQNFLKPEKLPAISEYPYR